MAVQPRIVALVPMKGHSERVPNKNFRTFNGKPLYRWILDALLGLDEVAEVVINTDARAIFESQGVGGLPRVRLRDRKPELCGDFVSMNKVLADDVANVPADIYLMTHSTNPLLLPDTIRKAIGHYRAVTEAGAADSLFAVNRFQTRFYDGSGRPINHDPDAGPRAVVRGELQPLHLFGRELRAERRANRRAPRDVRDTARGVA
jgi:CMP-N-acetylneuraminic acid synthetase